MNLKQGVLYGVKNGNANQKRIPQPTSNTLFMPMVIVFGSFSESGVMFSACL